MWHYELIKKSAAMMLAIGALVSKPIATKKNLGFSTAVNWDGSLKVLGSDMFTTVAAHGTRIVFATGSGTQWYLFTKTYRSKLAYLK